MCERCCERYVESNCQLTESTPETDGNVNTHADIWLEMTDLLYWKELMEEKSYEQSSHADTCILNSLENEEFSDYHTIWGSSLKKNICLTLLVLSVGLTAV